MDAPGLEPGTPCLIVKCTGVRMFSPRADADWVWLSLAPRLAGKLFLLIGEGMPRAKIEIVDTLPRSPVQDDWLEEYLLTDEGWPGLGKKPELEEVPTNLVFGVDLNDRKRHAAFRKWSDEMEPYRRALYADPKFLEAATEFLKLQRKEPLRINWSLADDEETLANETWAYRDKILRVASSESDDEETTALLIKHHVLRLERHYEKIRREVEALENMEKLEGVSREPISESVRLFVWQRDKGQCVKCGRREKLEFDHIIPIASGGSNTERNIQLLCENCNRSKGATI